MRFSKEPVLHNGSSRPTNTSFRVLQMQISPFLRSHGALDLSIKGGYDGGRNTMRSTIGVEIHYNTFQWGEKYDATKFEKRLFFCRHSHHSFTQRIIIPLSMESLFADEKSCSVVSYYLQFFRTVFILAHKGVLQIMQWKHIFFLNCCYLSQCLEIYVSVKL